MGRKAEQTLRMRRHGQWPSTWRFPVVRERRAKPQPSHTPTWMAYIHEADSNKCWSGVRISLILSFTDGENAKWCSPLGGSLALSYKIKHSLTTQPSNCTLRYLPKWIENWCPYKNLYAKVYSSFLKIARNWKGPRCPSTGKWKTIRKAVTQHTVGLIWFLGWDISKDKSG